MLGLIDQQTFCFIYIRVCKETLYTSLITVHRSGDCTSLTILEQYPEESNRTTLEGLNSHQVVRNFRGGGNNIEGLQWT